MNKLVRGPEVPESFKKEKISGWDPRILETGVAKKNIGEKLKAEKKILQPPLRLGNGRGRVGKHLVALGEIRIYP